MADAIGVVVLHVLVQENGIIRHPNSGEYLGRLDGGATFEKVKEFVTDPLALELGDTSKDENVRVVRTLTYEGPLSWVRNTLARGLVPAVGKSPFANITSMITKAEVVPSGQG